jgi:hypothetical protein
MAFRTALAHLNSDANLIDSPTATGRGPRYPVTKPDQPDEPHNPDRPAPAPDESPAQYPDHPNEPIEIN